MLIIILLGSCSKNNNSASANNLLFNQHFKHHGKILPTYNIFAVKQRGIIAQTNYKHYVVEYNKRKQTYEDNNNYLRFLAKNDIKKIKNIQVETLPKKNLKYIEELRKRNSNNELNKIAYLEMEYIMFMRNAIVEKANRMQHGEPIRQPYVYDKTPRTDRHIVMGNEYHKWHSWCEVESVC